MIPKLAIIIPYYKIDFFEETLQSVAAQTDKRFTLYIGNDASPKNPKNLIEKHFPDGNYKYYNYKENVGGKNLALQWERILENVTEEWFQILGDDDMIAENFVEEFYNNLENYSNVNFIKANSSIIDDNNNEKYSRTINIEQGKHNATLFFLHKLNGYINSSLSEHIFRYSSYKKHFFKKYPLAWHSDDYFLLAISRNFPNFYFLANTKVYIKETTKSISGNNSNLEKKQTASKIYYHDVMTLFKKSNETSAVKNKLIDYLLKNEKQFGWFTIYYSLYSFSIATLSIIKQSKNQLMSSKIIKKFITRTKYLKYLFAINTNPLLIKQRKKPNTIPVIIINYNQLYFLKQLIGSLIERNYENIIIIDNKSSYQPLLEYYKTIQDIVTIDIMDENFGFDVFVKNRNLQKKYAKGYFFMTDADIVPNENLPMNFGQIMLNLLDKYFSNITKVGFAIDINDIPEYYPLRDKVRKWEKQYWNFAIEENIYKASVDTTFALYKPNFGNMDRELFLSAIRVGGNFTAKHGGWYVNPKKMSEEQKFYLETANQSSSWRIDKDGTHLSTEYDKYS